MAPNTVKIFNQDSETKSWKSVYVNYFVNVQSQLNLAVPKCQFVCQPVITINLKGFYKTYENHAIRYHLTLGGGGNMAD